MDDPITVNSFLKAALFTQVLKTSVALSVLKDCPPGLNVADFVNELQNAHAFYEVYRDKSFYHSNQLKTCFPLDFEEIVHPIGIAEKQNDCDCLADCLSQLRMGISSISIGLRGMLDSNSMIAESFILPGVTFTFQSLIWVATYSEALEEAGLLNQVSLLYEEANEVVKKAGEISAKLDVSEHSTEETVRLMMSILDLICNVKQDDIYFGWFRPIRNFLTSYTRAVQNNDAFGAPHIANSLSKYLLKRCCDILIEKAENSASVNESFPRIYSLLYPLLNAHQHKVQVGANLAVIITRCISVIEDSQIVKNDEFRFSNGTMGLLNVLKNKLHCLTNLSS
ncbi:hypothetical protein Aperf_G00000120242 [Anoplocephala perfoliata]